MKKRFFLALFCAAMLLPAAAQWNPGDNNQIHIGSQSNIEYNSPEMIRKADGSTILVYRTFGYQTNPETQQKDTERQFYLYLQILDPDGNKKWDGNGKLISYKPTDTAMFGHLNLDTLSNGNIIMTFADIRPADNDNYKEVNGDENHTNIKPCKIIVYCYDQEGNSVWSPDGVMMPYHIWDPTAYVTYYAGEQLAVSDDKIYLAAHILEQYKQGQHDVYSHYAELACFDANGTLLSEKHYDAYSWYNFELAAAPEGKAYFVYADENDHYSALKLGPDCENTWSEPKLVEPYGVVSREASSAVAFPPSDMIPMSDGSVGMIYKAFMPDHFSQCYYNSLYPDGSVLPEHVLLSDTAGYDHSHVIMIQGDTLHIAECVQYPRSEDKEFFLYVNSIKLDGTRLLDRYDGYWLSVNRGKDPFPLGIVKADENYNVLVFEADYVTGEYPIYSYTFNPEDKLFQRKQVLNNVYINDVVGFSKNQYAYLIFTRDPRGQHGLWIACIDGTDYTNSTPITGELPGKFTVNAEGKQVQFSKANLQYMPVRQTYFFAANQMFVQGELNRWISETDLDFEDLFGWGTGNNPILVSQNDEDYPTFHDWGKNEIMNSTYEAGTWRSMSKDEWDYLFNGRADAAQKRAIGQVTMGKLSPYLGLFLLPDKFEMPSGIEMDMDAQEWEVNSYSPDTLLRLEKAGVVFLPAGGFRTGLNIHDIELHGDQRAYNAYYWTSSTGNDQYDSDMIYISKDGPEFQSRPRSNGMLVRLVKDVDSEQGIEDVVVTEKDKTRKVLIDGQLYIIRDGKTYNALGTEVR